MEIREISIKISGIQKPMPTTRLSNQVLSNPDWIDLYLAEPTGGHISDFPETINQILRSSPIISIGWSSSQLNEKFLALLSQFGRFWVKITPNDPGKDGPSLHELFYRTTSGIDVHVNDLSMSYSHRTLIARVNGRVVPTICLAQLKTLLQKYDQGFHQNLLKSIHHHWPQIEDAIERHRIIFNSNP